MSYNKPSFVQGVNRFKDLDLNFIAHPVTGNISKKLDLDSIKQSIKVLLFTHLGEKPFDPTFGSKLNNLLFEPMTRFLRDELDLEIRRMLGIYEPRISILQININQKDDENEIGIEISFIIIGDSQPITVNVLLKRIR